MKLWFGHLGLFAFIYDDLGFIYNAISAVIAMESFIDSGFKHMQYEVLNGKIN